MDPVPGILTKMINSMGPDGRFDSAIRNRYSNRKFPCYNYQHAIIEASENKFIKKTRKFLLYHIRTNGVSNADNCGANGGWPC